MPHMAADTGDVQYADHDVQVITNQVSVNGSGGSDSITMLDQLNPVSNRGLDSDELAELVAMYRFHYVDIDDEIAEDQNNPGAMDSESALGINLSEPEVPNQANANNATAEDRRVIEATDETIINNVRGSNYDEPGALDFTRLQTTSGFVVTATDNGSGSGAGSKTSERFVNFRDAFGSGPYVDQTDDITVFIEASPNQLDAQGAVETGYTLYWNVQEMPEGRASFARP